MSRAWRVFGWVVLMTAVGSSGLKGQDGSPGMAQVSPREQADRLFNLVMVALGNGDVSQVQTFGPMALAAYDAVRPLDIDARLHIGLIHLALGNPRSANAQADSIAMASRSHLFGPLLRLRVADALGDGEGARAALAELRANWDREHARNLEEYAGHQFLLDMAHDRAYAAGGPVAAAPRPAAPAPVPARSAAPAPARLPVLRPSVTQEVRTGEQRILDAAARARACPDREFAILRETSRNRISSISDVEGKAGVSRSTWDYKVVEGVAEDIADELKGALSWSRCPEVRRDLVRLWEAQARRVADHRNGRAASSADLADASDPPPPAPSAAVQLGAALGQALADKEIAEAQRRQGNSSGSPSGSRSDAPPPRTSPPPASRQPEYSPPPAAPPAQAGIERAETNRAAGCGKIERDGNNWFIRNQCTNVRILAEWFDEDWCRAGCSAWGMSGIPPGARETITPVKGGWFIASCEYPHGVIVTSRNAAGQPATYSCTKQ